MKRIIIGGIPQPIGGVTTYLRRLLHRDSDRIERFLDIYPGDKEPVREDCREKIVELGGTTQLFKWLWKHRTEQVGRELFFNFSTPRALLLTLILPKVKGAAWVLMLHHGTLTARGALSRNIARFALRRFDAILSLSTAQTGFYRTTGVSEARIVAGSSYCEPADHIDDPDALVELNRIKASYRQVVVMSGFPKPLYNLQMGVEAMAASEHDNCALCLFIYGPGDLRAPLKALAAELPWLFVFDGRSERYFNTFLRHSDLLMRLTTTESFGISVWDADYWGRHIIATDVCERPKSTAVVMVEGLEASHIDKIVRKELEQVALCS